MTAFPNDVAADAALSFLQSRVADQARRDSIPLSSAELEQLVFTEETASGREIAEIEAFDGKNDQAVFEQKISKLLLHAYERDVENGMKGEWDRRLSALQGHDVYVLVMVDMAGIDRAVDERPVFSGMQLSSFFGDLSLAEARRKLAMPLLWLVFIFTSLFCFLGVLGARHHEFPADQRSEVRELPKDWYRASPREIRSYWFGSAAA